MMLKHLWKGIAVCAFASCHGGESPVRTERASEERIATETPLKAEIPPETALQPTAPQPKADAFPACPNLGFSFELKGLPQERVLERFGPPAKRETYRAGDRGGEFYVAIEVTYPPKVPANRDVPIEEWTWTSGECILTVWFHRVSGAWLVLHDIYRDKDVAF